MTRTNCEYWFDAIGAADHNVALWSLFHDRPEYELQDLREMPWWEKVDKILLIGAEGYTGEWPQADQRIWVWDSRYLPEQPRFHSFFWWWWQTAEVERYQNAIQKLQDPRISVPRYCFECAITTGHKPNRQFPVRAIQQSELLRTSCLIKTDGSWIPGTDREIQRRIQQPGGNDRMQTYGHGQAQAPIVTWIPYLIYNQAWFSVLAESRWDYNFFTEKTAKLLLARRMFVAFGARYLLRELRAMGFQTFDCVIDESYDCESDDRTRWQMATEQMQQICVQDPAAIYQKVLPILEHNHQHLLRHDLQQVAQSEMIKVLNDK